MNILTVNLQLTYVDSRENREVAEMTAMYKIYLLIKYILLMIRPSDKPDELQGLGNQYRGLEISTEAIGCPVFDFPPFAFKRCN